MVVNCIYLFIKIVFVLALAAIVGLGSNSEWKFVSGTFSGENVQACYREDIVSERRAPGYSIIGCNFHVFNIDLLKSTARQKTVNISNIVKLDYYNGFHVIGYLSNRVHFWSRAPWYAKSNVEERLGFIDLSNRKVVARTGKWPELFSSYQLWQDDGRGKLVGHLYSQNGDRISVRALCIKNDEISEYSGDSISDLVINDLGTASNGRVWRSFGDPSYGVYSMRCKNVQDVSGQRSENLCMTLVALENRENSVRELWRTRIPGWFREAIFVRSSTGKQRVVMGDYFPADGTASTDRFPTNHVGVAMFSNENGVTVVDEKTGGTVLCRDDCRVGVIIRDSANDGKPIFSERLFKRFVKLIVFDGRKSDIIPKDMEIEIK